MKNQPDSPAELRARALRLLARREHSRAELERKLDFHAESPEIVAGILEALVQKKQLSDERFAAERARQLSRKYGTARIRHDLRGKGVPAEYVERLCKDSSKSELERGSVMLLKKFPTAATNFSERAKRMRFLQGRGFSSEIIRSLLSSRDPG